jgi:F0F1-type ATP synthase membrane subunit b/b'
MVSAPPPPERTGRRPAGADGRQALPRLAERGEHKQGESMSTIVIIAIIVGVLIVAALIYFVTRGSDRAKRSRAEKEHRGLEMRHAADRERAEADAHHAKARAESAEAERKAHEHERRASELEREAGKHGNRKSRR